MKLYGYFRSSATYRVRIALNLKSVAYDRVSIDLDGGEAGRAEYRALNPQGLVPVLIDNGRMLNQSLAILEYLEDTYPDPPLLPRDPAERARVRALALMVACEIQPLDNLRVLNYLRDTLGVGEEQRLSWYRHWVVEGFKAIEAMLAGAKETGRFCHGDTPTLADVCLVPQVANAVRREIDLRPYPTIKRIDEACRAIPAFERARPENQPGAA